MPVATRWPLVGRRDELDTFMRSLADPGCEVFCVYGPSGVGKTRLGDECLALAAAAGRRALRATADRSTEAVPLGAVAHLLSTDALAKLSESDVSESVLHARLFDAARASLAAAETADRTAEPTALPVLLLDDAHRFDSSSLAIVDRLLHERVVFGIATVVTGEAVPEAVTRWWRDERGIRIDLADLDPVGVDTLLHVALEGPLDATASSELWRASRGNLLALRELVAAARGREVLLRRDGVWHLEGSLGTPRRLRELVEARIAGLPPAARAVLELLALCQPVGLGLLERSAGLTVLEQLEREGLIVVRADGRRESVRLAHPIHADVVRAGLHTLRARSILIEHAATVEAFGARRREDPLRIATWRLEATGRADPELLLRAARLARFDHDYRQTAKLARAVLANEPSATAGLLLGEALYNLGSFEEAETVLADATDRAAGDDELVPILSVRRRNLFRGCRRDDEALEVGQRATDRLVSASARAELLAGEAEILALSGRATEALQLVEQIDTAMTPRLAVLVAIARGAALALVGRTTEALAVTRQAYRDHVALGDELAIAFPGTHLVTHTFALVQAGRLAEASEQGRIRFDVASRGRSPLGVAWLGVHLGRAAIVEGLPVTAMEWAERASAAMDTSGLEGLRPMACAVQAMAHGLLGDARASALCADQAEGSPSGFGFFASEIPLGRAWAMVAAGEVPVARSLLLAAAGDAERAGHLPAAAWLLHDAVRVGAAADAGEPSARLAALRARTESELVAARADHAAALGADDPAGLATAADRFAAIGAAVLAAEAAAAAADAWRRRREQRRAAALDMRSDELLARCEGARTPALLRARTAVPLTDREREIAMLAAAGQPSRIIAERLYLSVRTVDNHLGRIYTKLGVSSRAELAVTLERGQR
jgi:DNA-binding CsgD family transcriptional regulator/tetratricopeptide (TPR) repeat protein